MVRIMSCLNQNTSRTFPITDEFHCLLPGFGLAGEEAGKLGANKLYRAKGSCVQLDGQSQVEVAIGDTLF